MQVSKKAYNNAILNLQECKSQKSILASYPLKLYIEPTELCNLRCDYCYDPETKSKQMLDMSVFHALEDQLFSHLCEVNLSLSGEPTIHKNFPDMLDTCAKYPLITKLFTNLSYSNDKLLEKMVEAGSWVNVSFDGFSPINLRRGSDTEQIIKNIKFLLKLKKDTRQDKFHLRIAVVVGKNNVKTLSEIIDWARVTGIKEVMFGCLDACENLTKYALTAEDAPYFDQAMRRADVLRIRLSSPSHIGGVKLDRSINWNDFSLNVDKYFPHFCELCNPDADRKFCPYPWIQTTIQSCSNVASCCMRRRFMGHFSPDVDFIKDVWNNDLYQRLRSQKEFTSCTDDVNFPCNMINYSIWGGERILCNIPDPMK